jgi:hypothetical protein
MKLWASPGFVWGMVGMGQMCMAKTVHTNINMAMCGRWKAKFYRETTLTGETRFHCESGCIPGTQTAEPLDG